MSCAVTIVLPICDPAGTGLRMAMHGYACLQKLFYTSPRVLIVPSVAGHRCRRIFSNLLKYTPMGPLLVYAP
jgi:hypothetical protein